MARPRRGRSAGDEPSGGLIGTAVIDEENFIGAAQFRHNAAETFICGYDIVLLVVERDDYRDLD